jgi:hypothetical protein
MLSTPGCSCSALFQQNQLFMGKGPVCIKWHTPPEQPQRQRGRLAARGYERSDRIGMMHRNRSDYLRTRRSRAAVN